MACGLRAFTLLIYLNDVPDGGETVFTKLNVSVAPRKGAAVLWSAAPREATERRARGRRRAAPRRSNVDDLDPLDTCDERTFHEARPVADGLKHAANVWFHTHDFRTPYCLGCTG